MNSSFAPSVTLDTRKMIRLPWLKLYRQHLDMMINLLLILMGEPLRWLSVPDMLLPLIGYCTHPAHTGSGASTPSRGGAGRRQQRNRMAK